MSKVIDICMDCGGFIYDDKEHECLSQDEAPIEIKCPHCKKKIIID